MDTSLSAPNIVHAAERAVEDPEDAPACVDHFKARWGGLDDQSLSLALREGEESDKLFAIRALGYQRSHGAAEALAPFLGSTTRDERWTAAVYLARLGDRGALRVLYEMLDEGLPPDWEEYATAPVEVRFLKRTDAPLLLAELGDVDGVPRLTHFLRYLVRLAWEGGVFDVASGVTLDSVPSRRADMTATDFRTLFQAVSPEMQLQETRATPFSQSLQDSERQGASGRTSPHVPLRDTALATEVVRVAEDTIYYLGRLGAIGSLSDIDVPPIYKRLWITHLLVGRLHGTISSRELRGLATANDFSQGLAATLGEQLAHLFGLSEDEQRQAIAIYGLVRSNRVAIDLDYANHVRRTQGLL